MYMRYPIKYLLKIESRKRIQRKQRKLNVSPAVAAVTDLKCNCDCRLSGKYEGGKCHQILYLDLDLTDGSIQVS